MTAMTQYHENLTAIIEASAYAPIVADVFYGVLQLIDERQWEGACHPTASILYVLYSELGYDVVLKMGEVQIDHRFFDHSWVELDGQVIDASLLSPINRNLGLVPVFLDLNLDTMTHHTLRYGAVSSLGLSEFTEIIYHRPFHKYMNPTPFGKGKWRFIESISKALSLDIDIAALPHKYKDTKRILVRDRV